MHSVANKLCNHSKRKSAYVRHGVPDLRNREQRKRATTYTNPLRTAQTAAWVRSVTPILRKTCCTCSLTVS
jgi:hypothetical protein